jgi:hypothetical protein
MKRNWFFLHCQVQYKYRCIVVCFPQLISNKPTKTKQNKIRENGKLISTFQITEQKIVKFLTSTLKRFTSPIEDYLSIYIYQHLIDNLYISYFDSKIIRFTGVKGSSFMQCSMKKNIFHIICLRPSWSCSYQSVLIIGGSRRGSRGPAPPPFSAKL